MTKTHSDVAILRHKTTNKLYRYLGEDEYINVITGKSGKIKPEDAREMFVINLEMTAIIGEYPLVQEMITRLKLSLDK